ncbi:hypothetical protein [Polyangium mundeleinium]|uniref:Uncharacterized protein n=1 Tax=Polyangium mundeleinium TaxID=2995306 RepID=A0ABT5EQL0_9BACT|nr:hypothetical protein [Polyangium mundeleinium]MDC0743647.1 hypothetical protein [Polyangium mundeleinium]
MTKRLPGKTTSPRSGRRRLALGAVVLAAGLLLFWQRDRLSPRRAPSEDELFAAAPARAASDTPAPRQDGPKSRWVDPKAAGDDGAGARERAERRLERTRHTLEGYLQATRYPPGARPLSEKPDLQKAHSVAKSTQPLARSDKKLTDARVTLEQDRLYLVGDEAARLKVSCTTSEGPARCEVLRAEARVPETMPQAGNMPAAPVVFADEGGSAVTTLFAPAKEGFGGYHGPIAVNLDLRIDGEEGGARFDVIYTPAPPARLTGDVREVLENGSLCLYLRLAVDKPGRYVVVGRVDDADGDGFAYLEHNDPLDAGTQEAKMCIFGKLVLDERAKSPFVLRDVEAYLLKEDTYPDRELVPGRDGPFYTTKAYAESVFSDAEWQSEERDRHVKEFTKDVKEAEGALEALP